MTKIIPHINEEYYDLVPRPSSKTRLAIKISIERDGQQEPITVNEKGVIIDGHTRFEICEELNIKCDFIIRESKSEKEEINHFIIINSKRRNLNDFQLYELFEEQIDNLHKENIIKGRKKQKSSMLGLTDKLDAEAKEKTRTALRRQASELTGILEGNITMARYLKKHASPELLDGIRDGVYTISQANTIIIRENAANSPDPIKPHEKKSKVKSHQKTIISNPPEISSNTSSHKIQCPTCDGTGEILI